ncbi:methionyl-tRNA formyltransferase [Synechococcus sp. A15-28]|uniref:methionyl-tRNA formyltransferase n=1 Tax=Synechococcus sp. A15-28 TaxID=1050638 RepID=UPI001648DCF2|nr:methionyl-tRNA formyltransferase [Synechococcus sp. A15-28]QNI42287.1 methionyl-tRNA formyltransferase [Synechococcus sp. A15-28]
MRILYWGTPAYAVPTLTELHNAGHTVVGVVSQPDRRRGRGKQLVPSAVKQEALKLNLPVFTPERIKKDAECQQQLAALGADLSVVVAFGQILPVDVLEQPALGCWNGHGSLLPRWRGAAPIQWSILSGDTETGVGVMAMEEGLDTGPVLLERKLTIGLLDNAFELGGRLSRLTAQLMVDAMPLIEAAGAGSIHDRWQRLGLQPQADESCYARMLSKQDFLIDWNGSALAIHRQVMGLYPGAQTSWDGKRLKLSETEPLIERLRSQLSVEAQELIGRWPTGGHPCGTVLACIQDLGLVVSSSGCPLLIREAQLEGKARSRGQALVQQLAAAEHQRLGQN